MTADMTRLHDAVTRLTGLTGAANYALAGAVLAGRFGPLRDVLDDVAVVLDDAFEAIDPEPADTPSATVTELHPKDTPA